MFYSSNYWGIVSFSIAMIGYVSFLKGHVLALTEDRRKMTLRV